MFSLTLPRLLIGSVIVAVVGALSTLLTTTPTETTMSLNPPSGIIALNEPFTVAVTVTSPQAVNAFSGMVVFDDNLLEVTSISYNTSIANLWVEEPWYSAGDGIITFAGGTTAPGGFTGTGNLLEVTFAPIATGNASIGLRDAHILEHDGFGTEVALETPVDALFTDETLMTQAKTVAVEDNKNTAGTITIVPDMNQFDLNSDGQINLADISIFMLNSFGNDPKFDFNRDGKVNLGDLSMLLEVRRQQ